VDLLDKLLRHPRGSISLAWRVAIGAPRSGPPSGV
jgi:hypothetical protein